MVSAGAKAPPELAWPVLVMVLDAPEVQPAMPSAAVAMPASADASRPRALARRLPCAMVTVLEDTGTSAARCLRRAPRRCQRGAAGGRGGGGRRGGLSAGRH